MLEGIAPEDIKDGEPLFGKGGGLGLDSVDALELAIHIEEEFRVKIGDDANGRKAFTSIDTLAAFIQAEAGRAAT